MRTRTDLINTLVAVCLEDDPTSNVVEVRDYFTAMTEDELRQEFDSTFGDCMNCGARPSTCHCPQ